MEYKVMKIESQLSTKASENLAKQVEAELSKDDPETNKAKAIFNERNYKDESQDSQEILDK
jgi:hypothetical protein